MTQECKCENRVLEILSKFKGKKGSVMPALQAVQAEFGYLSEQNMKITADELEVPISQIYGVVTFYTQFRLKPVGEHIIKVCHGTACHVSGAQNVSEALRDEFGLTEDGETTSDGKYTLESVACLGCCSLAPVMTVDAETHAKLTPDEARKIVKK